MSALPRKPDPSEFGYLGLRMTAEEFVALEETPERYDLVHGVVCMSPRPTTLHQRLIFLIQHQLEAFAAAHPGHRHFAEVDLVIAKDTVYVPDVVCYRPGRITGYPARLDEAPDLLIEVLSPGTKSFDLTTKWDDYEACGVGEYWVVETKKLKVRVYRREGKELMQKPVGDRSVESSAIPGFVLDLGPLREVCEGGKS